MAAKRVPTQAGEKMFGRQWFPESSQIGLTKLAISVEQHLNNKKYDDALRVTDQIHKLSSDNFYCQRLWSRIQWLTARKRSGEKKLRIYYSNFWPDHDPSNCQLNDLIEAATGRQVISVMDEEQADISMISCYGNSTSFNSASQSLKILFLGENVRPFYRSFDLSLSSDIQRYRGRNIYLPLWMLEVDWFGRSYPDRQTHKKNLITQDRVIDLSARKSSIVYIGNNSEPNRYCMINEIRDSGIPIDIYGSHSNPIDDKISLYSRYKLVICPENSMSPGYITEKPFHAWISGTRYLYSCYPVDDKLACNSLCIRIPEDWENRLNVVDWLSVYLDDACRLQVPALYSADELDRKFGSLIFALRSRLAQFL